MTRLPLFSPSSSSSSSSSSSPSSSSSYDFEMRTVFDKIETLQKSGKTGKNVQIVVGLQFPEGLKKYALTISSQIEEKTGASVYISADPCFGACDLDMRLLERVDILFHFGHAGLNRGAEVDKVCFIETRSSVDITNAVIAALPQLPEKNVGLLTTVQHVHQLENAKKILEDAGKSVVIGNGDSRVAHPGQILGCNFSAAHSSDTKNCDVFLYVGSGHFHPIGAALSSQKRVVCADPFTAEVFELNSRKFLMQRSAVIGNAADAETFCILVSFKNGQYRKKLAESLKRKAQVHGKQAFLLFMDLVTPDQMLSFKADAFVNTACPRLAIDDSGRYPAPVLTPEEFEIVLGERAWEDLVLDEILEGGQD